ncbi:putative reverse transcriptase domain-containing protein, partial [Tanacetum coccineum]
LDEVWRSGEVIQGSEMGDVDINTLTMEQYLALTRGNRVVKSKIGNNVNFEIKSHFMRELREATFLRTKNDDALKHIEKRIPSGTINTWDLLMKAFIQMYYPPSKTAKQLEDIHNFKQEGDETLYQTWERLVEDFAEEHILIRNARSMKKLRELRKLIEMDVMSKKAPMGIVQNVLVKIDKFVFPFDFVVIDMLGYLNEAMILGIREDRILFDMDGNVHYPTVSIEKVCMANSIQDEESFNPLDISKDIFSYGSPLCLEFEKYNHLYDINENNEDTFVCYEDVHDPLTGRKGKTKMAEPRMVT